MRALIAVLLVSFCGGVAQAETIFTDKFLNKQPIGTLGLFSGGYAQARDAKKITVLGRQPIEAPRQKSCHVGAAHLQSDRRGEDTFVGFQVIKFFVEHDSPALIHVGRNPGWMSLPSRKPLPELKVKGLGLSFQEFAAFHGDAEALKMRPLMLQSNVEWHGAAAPSEEAYSGNREHALFWAENPLQLPDLAAVRTAFPSTADKIRIENRLIQFQLTDDPGSRKIPHITFDCIDPALVGVVVRAYTPFSTTARRWGVIRFR